VIGALRARQPRPGLVLVQAVAGGCSLSSTTGEPEKPADLAQENASQQSQRKQ
jgi:hypothetical protein